MRKKNYYPSKVMLVGEYGVVAGGSALTIPFRKFDARIRSIKDVPAGKEQEASQSVQHLKALLNYIKSKPEGSFNAEPDLDQFLAQVENHWLDMSIPIGYGLGSSGAVSAAVYDLFFPGAESQSLMQKKEDLANIESYFHGQSSGVDALTCYTDVPLYFHTDGTIQTVDIDPTSLPGNYRFFLLDSGERFDTGPLVKHFLESMQNSGFASSIRSEYLVVNQKLIEAIIGEREADPALLVRVLSDYQFTHFRKMIPSTAVDLWIEGQVSNEYYLKLNGSGGGFMLGITHDTSMDTLANRWGEKLIWID